MAVLRTGLTLLIGLSILYGGAAAEPPEDKPSRRTDRYGDPLPDGAIARCGTIRWRHADGFFVAYGHDGKTMLSVGRTEVRIWDLTTGRVIRRIDTGAKDNDVVAISNDGKLLAIVKDFRIIKIFDVETGKETHSLGKAEDTVVSIAISQDNQYLAARCHGESTPLVWRLKTKEKLKSFEEPKEDDLTAFFGGILMESRSVAFSPNGQYLATASERGAVAIWDVATGKLIRQVKARSGGPPVVAFSPDGKLFAWKKADGGSVIADVATGKELHTLQPPDGSAQYLAFTPDSKRLVTIQGSDVVQFWDSATAQLLHKLQGELWAVKSIAFSPDEKTLAAVSDCRVRQWCAATGVERRYPETGFGPMMAIALSPDCKTVATAITENSVILWEARTGKPTGRRIAHSGDPVFSPDSKTLALYDESHGKLALCDPATGKQRLIDVNDDTAVGALAFTPDGRSLIACYNREVHVFNTTTGKQTHHFRVPLFGETSPDVAMAADGTRLAAYGSFAAQGREVFGDRLFPRCNVANVSISDGVLSADGRMLALVVRPPPREVDGKAGPQRTEPPETVFFELTSGKERMRLKAPGLSVYPLRFSPNSRFLAQGGGKDVRIYELGSGKEVRQLQGHDGSITAIAFSADASRLVSASSDTTALVWDMSSLSRTSPSPVQRLNRNRLRELWSELADPDAAKAYRAIGTLAAAAESIPFLERELLAVARSFPERKKQIERLIPLLDSERYEERERATGELINLREDAETLLRAGLAGDPSTETRRRMRLVLRSIDGKPPAIKALRLLRAIEALEQAGTADARSALRRLADGPKECRLTREAKATLDRLEKLSAK
jgi:WD40 repeat protein